MTKVKSEQELIEDVFLGFYPTASIMCLKVVQEIQSMAPIFDLSDDGEYWDTLEEIADLLKAYVECNSIEFKVVFDKFMGNVNWGNWHEDDDEEVEDGEDAKTFTLGSIYFNKLTWIVEGSRFNTFKGLASKLLVGIPDLFNYFETKYS